MQKMVRLGNIYGEQFGTGFAGNVWDKDGIIPSLMTAQGGGRTPMIIEKKSGISVIGSLNPEKKCQDRVRVLSSGGVVNH